MKQATIKDFKPGAHLYDQEENEFVIKDKYDEGIWNAQGERGCKCVFESEARFYKIKNGE